MAEKRSGPGRVSTSDDPKPAKVRRTRTKKPKLCEHGYPPIPDQRGCAICWTRHPGFVKPKPVATPPLNFSNVVTREKCALPSQTGMPPLVRVPTATREPAKYEHRLCPSDTMAEAAPARRTRRFLRRTLAGSLRRHVRKMVRIRDARHERAACLRIEAARLERKLATQEKKRVRDEASTG